MEINRYQQGKIYKIVCNKTGKIYIGSTTEQQLCKRLGNHKRNYTHYLKNNKQGKTIASYEILANGDYDIVLIEIFPCNTKDELHMRERYHIENNECVNKQIPIRNAEEWKQYDKNYAFQNKDKIKERKKLYYEQNKDDIRIQRAEYREEHKDEIKEQKKLYYEANKERILLKQSESITCECGCVISKCKLARHQQTKKHDYNMLRLKLQA